MDMPQVVLFGSIGGDWRGEQIIPVLRELGVSYYDPTAPVGWTQEYGDREAEVMAGCETIIMVFNRTSPSFTSLAEAGWAALGAQVRGQHFIMQIDEDVTWNLPESLNCSPDYARINAWLQHWITSSRYLTKRHAEQFALERMTVVDTVEQIGDKLREIYASSRT